MNSTEDSNNKSKGRTEVQQSSNVEQKKKQNPTNSPRTTWKQTGANIVGAPGYAAGWLLGGLWGAAKYVYKMASTITTPSDKKGVDARKDIEFKKVVGNSATAGAKVGRTILGGTVGGLGGAVASKVVKSVRQNINTLTLDRAARKSIDDVKKVTKLQDKLVKANEKAVDSATALLTEQKNNENKSKRIQAPSTARQGRAFELIKGANKTKDISLTAMRTPLHPSSTPSAKTGKSSAPSK